MDDIVTRAAAESGWVAALLVVLVLSGFTTLGLLVRQIWLDVRDTRRFQQDTLVQLVRDISQQMSKSDDTMRDVLDGLRKFAEAIENAPCGKQNHVGVT